MLKAVFFDMDGILVDSESIHFEAWKAIADKHGIDFPPDDYHRFVGNSDIYLARTIVTESGKALIPEKLYEEKKKKFDSFVPQIKKMEGVDKLLKKLKGKVKICVVSSTNRKHVEMILKSSKIYDYFDCLVTADDVKKLKPAPDIYLTALKRMKIKPEECIVFEDSQSGVIAAKAAGLKVFAVPHRCTDKQDLSKADAILKSLKDVDIKKDLKLN